MIFFKSLTRELKSIKSQKKIRFRNSYLTGLEPKKITSQWPEKQGAIEADDPDKVVVMTRQSPWAAQLLAVGGCLQHEKAQLQSATVHGSRQCPETQ